jgi:hypothetical protein
MLTHDSRYADGKLFHAYTNNTQSYHPTILRKFPVKMSAFFLYEWKDTDRIDLLAQQFYNDPSWWWRIMDVNPEYSDPNNIPVGALLRIPNDR